MKRFSLSDLPEFARRCTRFATLALMVVTIAVAGAECEFTPECEAFCD